MKNRLLLLVSLFIFVSLTGCKEEARENGAYDLAGTTWESRSQTDVFGVEFLDSRRCAVYSGSLVPGMFAANRDEFEYDRGFGIALIIYKALDKDDTDVRYTANFTAKGDLKLYIMSDGEAVPDITLKRTK